MKLDDLPAELRDEILKVLPIADLAKVPVTSKNWRAQVTRYLAAILRTKPELRQLVADAVEEVLALALLAPARGALHLAKHLQPECRAGRLREFLASARATSVCGVEWIKQRPPSTWSHERVYYTINCFA